jgi:hypothetical protein
VYDLDQLLTLFALNNQFIVRIDATTKSIANRFIQIGLKMHKNLSSIQYRIYLYLFYCITFQFLVYQLSYDNFQILLKFKVIGPVFIQVSVIV